MTLHRAIRAGSDGWRRAYPFAALRVADRWATPVRTLIFLPRAENRGPLAQCAPVRSLVSIAFRFINKTSG